MNLRRIVLAGLLTTIVPFAAASAQLVEVRRAADVGLLARLHNAIDSAHARSAAVTVCSQGNAAKMFERGVVEAFSSGVLQASSQLVRLCVGQPGNHFRLPIYFFVGATDPAGARADNSK